MPQKKQREAVKHIDSISITPKQLQALSEIKRRLLDKFDIKAFFLYGSVARGQADEESDVDLLIVTSQPLTRFKRHEITNVVFEVNLQHDTNFSTLVVDHKSWETGIISVLPVKDEIYDPNIQL